VSVDIFTADRELETQEIELRGDRYTVLTPEERYLSMARDMYQTLTKDRILDPKHIAFLAFLEDKVDRQRLEQIWSAEALIIKRHEDYPFTGFEEYLEQIRKLTEQKKQLIEEKIPGTQKRPYNIPRHEAFGITVENEEAFYAAYEKKRNMMEK
jgi:hypothetical protein